MHTLLSIMSFPFKVHELQVDADETDVKIRTVSNTLNQVMPMIPVTAVKHSVRNGFCDRHRKVVLTMRQNAELFNYPVSLVYSVMKGLRHSHFNYTYVKFKHSGRRNKAWTKQDHKNGLFWDH